MPRARLTVSVPEETWIHAGSTAFPDATFRVVTALAGEDVGVALIELSATDVLGVLMALERRADVTSLELLWSHEREALVQVETTSPPLLLPLWRAGVPVALPFVIRDGEATWDLATGADRFSALGDHLAAADVEYDVEYVREFGSDEADHVMTDRQREVLLEALEMGYYATPRAATLTEVASALGVSKATCSDVLHRAEGNLVRWFVDRHLSGSQQVTG